MNRVSKLVKTGTSTNPIYERTIYIDGIFEYHILENGTTYEKNYVHIMDDQSRIAMVRIGTPFPDDIADEVVYNLEDQIGSNTIRLNNIGGIIDKEEYYPFGDSSFRTFTKKRYRYVGKEKDLESGLYYYGARYYAAWTCRFISIDPLASDYVHLTPYNYGGNKPINSIDIDGLQGENEPVTGGNENTGKTKDFQQETNENPPEITVKRIPIDQVSEKAKGSGWTRFWGGVKAVFGTIEAAAGVVLTSTGVLSPLGAILFVHGADVASSGARQAITGEKTETLTYQGAHKASKAAGASDEMATGIASGLDNGISLLSGFGVSAMVKNAGAKVMASESVAAKTGLSNSRALGIAGEQAVGVGSKTRIPSLTGVFNELCQPAI